MKRLLGTFVISLIVCYILLFIGAALIFGNYLWVIYVFVALIIAVLVTLFIHQNIKIEELEKRVKILESQSEAKLLDSN